MIDLKPCPFCGGKAELDERGIRRGWWVKCTECSAETVFKLEKKEAAAAWNARKECSESAIKKAHSSKTKALNACRKSVREQIAFNLAGVSANYRR